MMSGPKTSANVATTLSATTGATPAAAVKAVAFGRWWNR